MNLIRKKIPHTGTMENKDLTILTGNITNTLSVTDIITTTFRREI